MNENCNLDDKSDEELKNILQTLQQKLANNEIEDPLSSAIGKPEQRLRQEELMHLMHVYNDIKDATQIVLGALASREGLMLKQVHLDYNLPLNDE